MKKDTLQRGFSLIELMVVILIIAILGSLGVATFTQANRSARDGKRRADIESVRQALLLHRQENTSYLSSGTTPASGSFNTNTNTLVSAGYLSAPAPRDPGSTPYVMSGNTQGTAFCICAVSETGRGNSSNNSCNFSTSTGGFYCARQP